MRIAFVAPPFAGHFNPLVPLARTARERGHAVEFVTGELKWPVLRAQGFAVVPLASLGAGRLEAIANSSERVGSHPLRLLRQLRQQLALLPEIRREVRDRWTAERPDLVVADSVAPVAGAVCEALGIPWITTIATPFALENRRGTPSYCGGWGPERGLATRMRNAGGRLTVRFFKGLVARLLREEFRRAGVGVLHRADGTESIYSARAILGLGMSELELERDWPPAFRMIGPVFEAPEACPPLDFPAARRRVLVTLGTHLLWAKESILERVVRIARELPPEQREVEFVVSMGRPEDAGGGVERVAPGVSVCPFVSYQRDFAAFDAAIHHGGTGALYAAIHAGIPSLAVPHDYDQFDWAVRLEHCGGGLRARTLATAPVAELLRRREWPELGRLRDRAREYRPCEAFMEVVEEVA